MQIFLKALDGKSHPLEVESSDTVESLKSKVQSETGIQPEFQSLVYLGKQMELSRTLADYHVEKDSTVHLVWRVRIGKAQVFVMEEVSRTRYTIKVDLRRNTVLDVKKLIEEMLKIETKVQRLIYAGTELEDARSLMEYRVLREATLHLVVRLPGRLQVFEFVRNSSWKKFSISVDFWRHTVLDVKKLIQERLNIEPEGQSLIYCGFELKEYKVADGSTLHVVARLPDK